MIDHWDEITEFRQSMGPLYTPSEYALALFMEVSELTDSFNFKPWKPSQNTAIDMDNMEREVVDCLFFLHHICECFSITPEQLNKRFEVVLANNKRRYITEKQA